MSKEKEAKQKSKTAVERKKKEVKKIDSKEKKEVKKTKKSVGKRIVGYFKGVKKEVSRIRWTKGKDLLKYSISTVVFIIILGIFFYGIDLLVALLRSSL